MKLYFLMTVLLLSCQTHHSQKNPKKTSKKVVKKSKHIEPYKLTQNYKSYKKCLRDNPKSITCNWEMGWIYYVEGKWDKVMLHWNIAKYISKNEKFKKNIDTRLELVNKLASLKFLTRAYKRKSYKTPARKIAGIQTDFSLSAVGDVMIGVGDSKNEISYIKKSDPFSQVKPLLGKSDLNFVNLEGMFCDNSKESKCDKIKNNCYSFKTPTKYFKHIKENFNLLSLANNHAMDYGESCMDETISLINENKLHYSNGFKTSSFMHKNLKIGFAAFHTSSYFDLSVNKIADAKKRIKKLKQVNDIVIVSFHGGAEGHDSLRVPFTKEYFFNSLRGNVTKFARGLVDNGADIILGHGPHIVRAMEVYKDRLIAYSLGNFATYGKFNLNGLLKYGVVLNVETNKKGEFITGQIHSTVQRGKGIPYMDQSHTSLDYLRALSAIDFPNSKLIFKANGRLALKQ